MNVYFVRSSLRSGLAALFAVALLASAAGAVPTNVRMQNVMKQFVSTTGQDVIGLGSWISGAKYKDVLTGGTSDHDLRLLSKGGSPAEVQREWMRARATLTDLVKKEFGQDADKVLKSINLYPPTQIMKGVEDASDALARFKKLGNMPNLGYTGPVADAPAAMAEGLYGPGAKVWTQGYEKSAGRLFYARGGHVFMGMTDLTHLSEGLGRYDVPGMCNTTGQWADHLAEEMHAGQGDKVAKYLERLDRDLAKAKDLSRLDLDPRWRARIKEIVKTLQKDPSKLADLQDEVTEIVKRSRDEAALLKRMAKASSVEKKLLAEVMKDMRSKGRLSKILGAAGEVVTLDRAITAVMVIVHVQQTAKFAGEDEMHQAISTAMAGIVGMASFPPGLMMDITNWTLEAAKSGGYDFAASTQEAWDLMAGVYTAVGRADVDAGPGYTLDQLVAKLDDEKKLRDVVYAKAMLAASRDAGEATGQVDQKVGEAIFNRCFPVILAAWQQRREELLLEYLDAMDELAHTPVLMKYTPCPAVVKPKQKASVTVTAEIADDGFDRKLGRAKEILTILCKQGVFVDFTWKWSGGKELSDPAKRVFDFDTTGVFPVSATVKVSAGAAKSKLGEAVVRRFDLMTGVDVRIEEEELEFNAKYVEFSILLSGPGWLVSKSPYHPMESERDKSEATTHGLQLLADDLLFVLKGNTFTVDYLEKGDFGKSWPAKVHVEGVFNDKKTMIERLTATWHAERNPEEVDRWSFTAHGIPLTRHSTSAKRGEVFEFEVDAKTPQERPQGFQLVSADYLSLRAYHKLHYDERNDVEIPYDELWREDQFQHADAEVGIVVRFRENPWKNPPLPMDVPR